MKDTLHVRTNLKAGKKGDLCGAGSTKCQAVDDMGNPRPDLWDCSWKLANGTECDSALLQKGYNTACKFTCRQC